MKMTKYIMQHSMCVAFMSMISFECLGTLVTPWKDRCELDAKDWEHDESSGETRFGADDVGQLPNGATLTCEAYDGVGLLSWDCNERFRIKKEGGEGNMHCTRCRYDYTLASKLVACWEKYEQNKTPPDDFIYCDYDYCEGISCELEKGNYTGENKAWCDKKWVENFKCDDGSTLVDLIKKWDGECKTEAARLQVDASLCNCLTLYLRIGGSSTELQRKEGVGR